MATERKSTSRTSRAKAAANAPQQDEYGHLQPQEPRMEQAVLGALMVEKDAYYRISDILRSESFYEKRHRLIFDAIRKLNMDERPVDILTVTEQLQRDNLLEDVGGPFYITQLSGAVASSAHIEYHARIIAQKALARELITYTSDIQGKAFDATTDVDELMQEAEGKLFELSQNNVKRDYTSIDPVLAEAMDMLSKAMARPDGMSGIPSGYHELDKKTAGWQNSDLIILAARPSMGKTAFAMSMAKNIAVDQRIPMALFSLEMANVQ
ncbi:MAG: replicative DNA helicase, partial [Alloprevotella sp.]|nr:replicative DNA helicase [Alloprevotella sp.]